MNILLRIFDLLVSSGWPFEGALAVILAIGAALGIVVGFIAGKAR